MSTRSRRWFLAVLALAVTAGAGIVGFLALGEDPLEAARRRVPLGGDEGAVARAVGRPANGVAGGRRERPPHMLYWEYGEGQLLVHFDEDGRAVWAGIDPRFRPFLWERFLEWLGL
jgi:hypothetical protein